MHASRALIMSAAPESSIAEAAAVAVHRLPSIAAAVDEPAAAASEEPPAAPVEEPANELSAYEQQRLKQIEANQQKLRELGLLDDVEALRAASKPKKPKKKKEPKDATAIAPKRSSRRITGEGVLPDATGDDEDEQSDRLDTWQESHQVGRTSHGARASPCVCKSPRR